MLQQKPKGKTTTPKSKRMKKKLLSLSGAWKDLDTEKLKQDIYRWRHESPTEAPTKL